jgi:ribA/ribD-fused uncharacterized protein
MSSINFWDQRKEYGWLSNFYNAPIVINGKEWATSEHYYQAQKHISSSLFMKIANAPTAAKAKRLSKKEPTLISELEKINNMRTAILAKFTQHEGLRQKLLDTEHRLIVEDSPVDSYWGIGESGDGINMMGLLLMELRSSLQTL